MLAARRVTNLSSFHSLRYRLPELCRAPAWPQQAPAAVAVAACADCCKSQKQQLKNSRQHLPRTLTAAAAASGEASAAAAASAAGRQQQPLPEGVDPEQLLSTLSRITTYTQLSAFVQSQSEVFLHTPLCVYAILHAVQLRDTLSFDRIGRGSLASEEAVIQQLELVRAAWDCVANTVRAAGVGCDWGG